MILIMKVIGITGSSGAGKSTICNLLDSKYEVEIINADKIAKELSKKGTEYLKSIVEKFGEEILKEDGELNRKKLANIIYSSSKQREVINSCTFKYIKKEIQKRIKNSNKEVIAIDAPLLFECGLHELCNTVIGIISKRELQIQRIVERDNISYIDAENRLNAQKDNDFYIENCNEIIENNNDISDIEKHIEKIAIRYNITKRLQ